MSRRIQVFILIVVFLWQSLGTLGSAGVEQRSGELAHIAVHGQSLDHHHHADQALHMGVDDAKPECGVVQHQHTDSGAASTGLPMVHPFALVSNRSQSPVEALQAVWLSPTLDGPLRPPKLPA